MTFQCTNPECKEFVQGSWDECPHCGQPITAGY